MAARGATVHCGFNRSMQHLISKTEGDVENEVQTEDLLHRNSKGLDVGSLAEGRFTACHRATI